MVTNETAHVDIAFEGRSINYRPSTAHARRNTLVQWRSADPFVVHFGKRTPFRWVQLHSHPDGEEYMAEAQVRSDAVLGTYRYHAAGVKKSFDFRTGTEGQVFVDHSADLQVDDLP
jgi:hypothetical protein